MMDESDDDFKELCASFFQRMKKNGTKEACGERKTQKASKSTQRKNTLKRTKPAATESKTPHPPGERKAGSGSQVSRSQKPGASKRQERAPAPSEHGEGGAAAELRESVRRPQTGNWAGTTAGTVPERQAEVTALLEAGGQDTVWKGPGSKIFWLCRPDSVCPNSSP